MTFDPRTVETILVSGGYISSAQFLTAINAANKKGIQIKDYLIDAEIISADIFGQAVAEFYKIRYADLRSIKPSRDRILAIPEDIAKKFRIVVFSIAPTKITIATDEPVAVGLHEALVQLFPGRIIELAYGLSEEIDLVLLTYKPPLSTQFSQIISKNLRVAPEIITTLLSDAHAFHSSDVHIEPQLNEVVVRFRIDGFLREVGKIPKQYYENILNKIKVDAHMRTDEHLSPQDGALRYENGEHSFDVRVSLVPTVDGEKIVFRLLSSYIRGFALSDLGLGTNEEKIILEAAKKPFGMIVVTGPTGSGKTTTLYSLIKFLNRPEINITTIEDPVEYKIPGVNQIQVNERTGMTFATGLRSIVRQDPNVILVGEIRDKETAEIGINAALTGHLLLSTFHANDAATAIPRFIDMGIEPFLLSSTLELIIAERLVRKICNSCRVSYESANDPVIMKYPEIGTLLGNSILYKGKGCAVCNGTGYFGRIGVFEFIRTSDALKELISSRPSAARIEALARLAGEKTMFEDGIEKVKLGITTLEELIRIAPPKQKRS